MKAEGSLVTPSLCGATFGQRSRGRAAEPGGRENAAHCRKLKKYFVNEKMVFLKLHINVISKQVSGYPLDFIESLMLTT